MLKKILIGIGVVVLIIGLWAAYQVVQAVRTIPSPEHFADYQPTQSTKIYDRTGEVLLYEIHGNQNRTVVGADQISDYAKKATIAIEDKNFYTHPAFDIKAIIRALVADVVNRNFDQGGSTITQQLVKNVFLTPEKLVQRKIKELILAYWIEQHYTKDQILLLYLNQIPYGSNSYGIESASETFFGVHAKDLTIAQSAYLASLIQAPSYYSPWGHHTDELAARKDYVLEQMKNLGFIDEQEYQSSKSEHVTFLPQNIGSIRAPHFVMMVKQYLENKYGAEEVENGGLKIITTLDWNLQQAADEAVKKNVERNKELYNGSNGALVAQDPKTGQILAMVGSADYFNNDIDGQFNVATQGLRQPGSTFKPFAYVTAFEKGYTPNSIVFDTPTEFSPNNPSCPVTVDFSQQNSQCFHPHNFDNSFRGPVPLKQGLAQSINVPSVKVLYLAGLSDTLKTAHDMGITTLNDPSRYGLSLVLGGGEVKLVDLVNAYAVFARDGVKHTQSFILKAEKSNGSILEEYKDSPKQVLEPQYARTITSILSDVQLRSGLFHSSLKLTTFDGYDVALKTGTTNDYRDAWTVGYTPFLTVGVWAGNNDYTPMKQQGGSILAAVPMWHDFMASVINTFPPESFQSPTPLFSSSPMVNGQYVIQEPNNTSPQVHSILYYINKDKPNDTSTDYSPQNEPQFYNWEVPVIAWATAHIPNFITEYNKSVPTGSSTVLPGQ